jgi:hypothetical protein
LKRRARGRRKEATKTPRGDVIPSHKNIKVTLNKKHHQLKFLLSLQVALKGFLLMHISAVFSVLHRGATMSVEIVGLFGVGLGEK